MTDGAVDGLTDVTVGVDMEPVDRFRDADTRLFTAAELAECAKRADPAESRAGRWCAKEAVVKACSAVVLLSPREIEVLAGSGGRPQALLPARATDLGLSVDISISHAAGVAIACAVVVRMKG